jgi:ribosomal protein S18 acetylase RimI-like enzyme
VAAAGQRREIRALDLPREAPLAVDVDMACNDDGYEPAAYRLFRENQLRRYGAMAAAGMGHWFGAFVQGQMVAGLGLFGRAGVGRFQHVSTHPAWRRRGLCRALVHAACRHGQEQRGWHTLVMCADPDDVAIGIYESLGFARQSTQWSLQRRAPHDVLPG